MKPSTDGHAERARETRDKLIEAGLSLFSRYGLDGVRTRELADRAGVNQSAIPYHFGGKDGVYAAVIRRVANGIVERAGLERILAEQPSGAAASARALEALMRAFTRALLDGAGESVSGSLLLAREQLQPSPVFDETYGQLFQPLHVAVTQRVAGIRGDSADDASNILRAHAILGQAIAFAVARQALLRRLTVQALPQAVVDEIAVLVGCMAVAAAKAG
ncbi:transcriptional regulator [Achromobacter sp. RTa]|uniref:CerR family C-terminal domain-containing protein n=1 Tax=Achromobacter sp. RTa TaxID=1532557 RepID=UPI0005106953|nr:CerR family C-terminal domain-containing protein [Achromobacter sp. RTa]KGD93357.1 transcriptional regulator [Achromobacter sp. RTa]